MTARTAPSTPRGTWQRGLLMLLVALLYNVAEVVLAALVLFQFGSHVITGAPNRRLLAFGRDLSAYIYGCMRFLTYDSERLPYPFSPWPPARVPEEALSGADADPVERA